MLKILFEHMTIEEFIANHPALSGHQNNYKSHINKLLQIFNYQSESSS